MGTRRCSQKERWIQDRTGKLIDERKMVKCQRNQARTSEEKEATPLRYQVRDRQVSKSYHNDKKAWMEKRGVKAQATAVKNDTKTFYRNPRFDTSNHAEDLEVNQGEITEKQIIAVIKSLKNNKTLGLDQITAEILKHGGNSTEGADPHVQQLAWNHSPLGSWQGVHCRPTSTSPRSGRPDSTRRTSRLPSWSVMHRTDLHTPQRHRAEY